MDRKPIEITKYSTQLPKDTKILEAIDLVASGFSDSEIAKKLDVTKVTIYNWKKEPAFIKEITKRQEIKVHGKTLLIKGLVEKTVDAYVHMAFHAKSEKEKRAALETLLKIQGVLGSEKLKANQNVFILNSKDIPGKMIEHMTEVYRLYEIASESEREIFNERVKSIKKI